jgi:hypothetical protein
MNHIEQSKKTKTKAKCPATGCQSVILRENLLVILVHRNPDNRLMLSRMTLLYRRGLMMLSDELKGGRKKQTTKTFRTSPSRVMLGSIRNGYMNVILYYTCKSHLCRICYMSLCPLPRAKPIRSDYPYTFRRFCAVVRLTVPPSTFRQSRPCPLFVFAYGYWF